MAEGDGTAGTRVLLGNQRKGVVALAVPIAVALLFQQINGIADNLWVSALGGAALAAVGVVYPVYAIITGIGSGLGIGASAAIARSIGRGDRRRAELSAAQGITIAVVVGLVLTIVLLPLAESLMEVMGAGSMVDECLDYAYPIFAASTLMVISGMFSGMLRGEGAARRSMAIQATGAVLNIVLDPILIHGFGMGVAGAGWATAVSYGLSCVMAVYWYIRGKGMYVRLRARDLRPDAAVSRDILSVGAPEALELSIMNLFNIFLNYMVIACGGTDTVGLYSAGWRMANLVLVPAQAFGGAMVAVCAAEYGMRRFDMIRDASKYAAVSGAVWTLALCVVLALLSHPIAALFTTSEDISYLTVETASMLRHFAVFLPVMSFVYTGSALLQAINRAAGAMLNSLARNILFALSFWVAATWIGTLDSLWLAMTLVEIAGGVMMGAHVALVFRWVSAAESVGAPT